MQIRKVQTATSFIKWQYSRSIAKCRVCGAAPPLTAFGAAAAASLSNSSFSFGVHFTHNRKHVTTRWASSASVENVEEYDYIIVGAGSAGCVLSNRLAGSDQATRVLLVEAGPAADKNWKVRMPAALMYLFGDPRYNWCYETVPQVRFWFQTYLQAHSQKFTMVGIYPGGRSATELPKFCFTTTNVISANR